MSTDTSGHTAIRSHAKWKNQLSVACRSLFSDGKYTPNRRCDSPERVGLLPLAERPYKKRLPNTTDTFWPSSDPFPICYLSISAASGAVCCVTLMR
jgi:hypothetical protein